MVLPKISYQPLFVQIAGKSSNQLNKRPVSQSGLESVEIGKDIPGKSYMLAGNYSTTSKVKSIITQRHRCGSRQILEGTKDFCPKKTPKN